MVDPSKSKPDWPEVIVHTLEAGLLLGQGTPAKDGLQVHPLPLDLVEVVQQLIEVCKTLLPHWCLVLKALVVRRVLQWLQQALVVSHLRRDGDTQWCGQCSHGFVLYSFTWSTEKGTISPTTDTQWRGQCCHSFALHSFNWYTDEWSTDTQWSGQCSLGFALYSFNQYTEEWSISPTTDTQWSGQCFHCLSNTVFHPYQSAQCVCVCVCVCVHMLVCVCVCVCICV